MLSRILPANKIETTALQNAAAFTYPTVKLLMSGKVVDIKDGIRTAKSANEEVLRTFAAVISINGRFFSRRIPSKTFDLISMDSLLIIFLDKNASDSLGGDGGQSRAYFKKIISTPANRPVNIANTTDKTDPTCSYSNRDDVSLLLGIKYGISSDETIPPTANAENEMLNAVAIAFGGNHLLAKVAGSENNVPVASPHINRPSITHT